MTAQIDIRPAQPEDARAIAGMLARLADELGDTDLFATTPEVIRNAGFGPSPAFSSFVAMKGTKPLGFALFFRHFSTTRGMSGVYVQDLWVAPDLRGRRLGERLLAAVAGFAVREWRAGYLSLTVHHDNPRAAHFYQRLGLAHHENDAPMSTTGAAFQRLMQPQGAAA